VPRVIRPVFGLALIAVACGSGGSSAPEPSSPGGSSSSIVSDPLVGEWRQDFTCEGLVKMLSSQARPHEFDRYVTGLIGEMDGVTKLPPLNDPCRGAPASFERIVKFAGGNVVFFDPPHLQDNGLHATYRVVDDRTFVVYDTMGNVSPSPLTCTFLVHGDRLTIQVRSDELYTLAGFQAAPWIRID